MKKFLFLTALAIYLKGNSQTGIITTIAGNGTTSYWVNGIPATTAELLQPEGIALDTAGNIYFADEGTHRIRKINTAGIIGAFAGNGYGGYTGDGGAAINATFYNASTIALDRAGNMYIVDCYVDCIRKVNTNGIISTFAGNGSPGYSGDGGQATAAELSIPQGVACDAFGNVFIADYGNSVVRKVDTAGIITTWAGGGGGGYSGDGGQAAVAKLYLPYGLAFDMTGNAYIVEQGNNCIRKVSTNGIITTIAGIGCATPVPCGTGNGYSGDGGQAIYAELNGPTGVAVDTTGNIYIADASNNRIRKINNAGIISTIAGNGTNGYSGDGGLATSAELNNPSRVAVDAAGNVYIADASNNVIRKVCVNNCSLNNIGQYNTRNSISIYPNPTTNMLHVEGSIHNDNISIRDVLGNEVINTMKKNIDVSSLQNGVYFIKTTKSIQTFIKQ